jgi:hypothetical protein
MSNEGYKKVGHKARRGKKVPHGTHGGHRKAGAVRDPISRAQKTDQRLKRLKGLGKL